MMDFKKQLISLLEREIPELADKIQAGAVDARTPAPFAAFSVPEETPVRTLHGIAGYRTMFEVAVYDSKFAGAERLKHRVIAALEGTEFDGKRSRFVSAATEYYADYDLHGATMSFRII
nr:MAG TPA: hypothetical protein [Bacteriophage sp.]